jgi:hypothetical protein
VAGLLALDLADDRLRDRLLSELGELVREAVVREDGLPLGRGAREVVQQPADLLDRRQVGQRAEQLHPHRDAHEDLGGRQTEVDLEPVEDHPVRDLLRLPHVLVEVAVDLGDPRQQRQQLQDVAVHLELDASEVVDDGGEALTHHDGVDDRPVDGVEADGRVLVLQLPDVLHDRRRGDLRASHQRMIAAV